MFILDYRGNFYIAIVTAVSAIRTWASLLSPLRLKIHHVQWAGGAKTQVI